MGTRDASGACALRSTLSIHPLHFVRGVLGVCHFVPSGVCAASRAHVVSVPLLLVRRLCGRRARRRRLFVFGASDIAIRIEERFGVLRAVRE